MNDADYITSIVLIPKEDRLSQEQKALITFLKDLKFFKERKTKDRDISMICESFKI